MLYVNTRERINVFTPGFVLSRGGEKYYLPYKLPAFSGVELLTFLQKDINQRIAGILNLFFRTELSGLDVAFAAGRNPIRIAAMPYKIAILETWHSAEDSFEGLVKALYHLVSLGKDRPAEPCKWFRIAVRIALLFAAFGELMKTGIAGVNKPIDMSLPVHDFESVMAVWIARKMGLPIGCIILSCDELGGLWEFFRYGKIRFNYSRVEKVPSCSENTEYSCFEPLIYATLGYREAERFRTACEEQRIYTLREDQLAILSKDILCTAVRAQRVYEIVPNFFKTNSYLMGYDTAFAYAGLQDYRAAKGETGAVLMLSNIKPQSGNG